jgi:acyl-CoA hydrolase
MVGGIDSAAILLEVTYGGAMSIQAQYQAKRVSAVDAITAVRDGDFIIVPTGVGEPPALLTALSDKRRDLHDVKVAQILAMRKYA